MLFNPTTLSSITGHFNISTLYRNSPGLKIPSVDLLEQVDLESYSYLLAIFQNLEKPIFAAITLEGIILLYNPYSENGDKEIFMSLKTSKSFQLEESSSPFAFIPICPISLFYGKITEGLYIEITEETLSRRRLLPLQGRNPSEEEIQLWTLAVKPKVLAFAQQAVLNFYDNIPF